MSVFRSMSSGLMRMVGFALGIGLFGITSLIAIPSMIRASGADAWGAIATGQAIGVVGAALVGYGSMVSGPAAVARAGRVVRMTEFLESLWSRSAIFFPVAVVASTLSVLFVRNDGYLAVLGCLTICAIGLSSVWYFVGTGQPYVLLCVETIPRVVGVVVGIVLMGNGASAAAGLICQGAGIAAGLVISSVYVLHWPRSAGQRVRLVPRPVMRILIDQRHGVTSSTVASLYAAVPIVIVGAVAPGALNAYAVLYKLQRQIATAVSPMTQVLQGWVPRAGDSDKYNRAHKTLLMTLVIGSLMTVSIAIAGHPLIHWLGNGQIEVQTLSIILTAVTIALATVEAIIGQTCLVPFGLLPIMAKITFWGSIFGLALIAGLGWVWLINGALAGLGIGLATRISLMVVVFLKHAPRSGAVATYGRHVWTPSHAQSLDRTGSEAP